MGHILFGVFVVGIMVGVFGVTLIEAVRSDSARTQCIQQNGGGECVFQQRFVPKNTN